MQESLVSQRFEAIRKYPYTETV
jgi:hypothetical protein